MMNVLVVSTKSTFGDATEAKEAKKELKRIFGSFATKIWREKEIVRMKFYYENIVEQLMERYVIDPPISSDEGVEIKSGLMTEDVYRFFYEPLSESDIASDMFEVWAYFKDGSGD